MAIFFWIMDLLVPFVMIVFGYLFLVRVPKNINMLYGYRTKWSMKSKDTWHYAHKLCGKIWLITGLLLLIAIVLNKLLSPYDVEMLSLIHMGISLLVIIILIPLVEVNLRKKFDENGVRK